MVEHGERQAEEVHLAGDTSEDNVGRVDKPRGGCSKASCVGHWGGAESHLGLRGEAEDIAQAFVYLMRQRHATGQSLVIDGGSVLV